MILSLTIGRYLFFSALIIGIYYSLLLLGLYAPVACRYIQGKFIKNSSKKINE